MSTHDLTYPFTPKSTRLLRRGQFWSIPLSDGRFGAGCVVGQYEPNGKVKSRVFIAGLVRWIGTQTPSASDLHALPLVEYAIAHLKVITESGGLVLGQANIHMANAPMSLTSLALSVWGFQYPKALAERLASSHAQSV